MLKSVKLGDIVVRCCCTQVGQPIYPVLEQESNYSGTACSDTSVRNSCRLWVQQRHDHN